MIRTRVLLLMLLLPLLVGSGCSAETDDVTDSSWVLLQITDGDTIYVRNPAGEGERVRLAGIDTPERGQCGFDEATQALTDFLTTPDEGVLSVDPPDGSLPIDRDRYARLVGYVTMDGVDAGLTLINAGVAVARYDSRDGYPSHLQEAAYIEADKATPRSYKCPTATPSPTATATAAKLRYPTCKEATAAGLGPYQRGVDVEYGWYADQDKDGITCER